jgi:diguanylate cyclase (GGDEF)-like protein/PAS domain S-box-containing protein
MQRVNLHPRIVPRWCDPALNKEIAGGAACLIEPTQLPNPARPEDQIRLNRALQALSSSTLAFGQIASEEGLLQAVCRITVECGYRRAVFQTAAAESQLTANAGTDSGVHAQVSLPMVVAGEPLGLLRLYAGEADAFDADETAILAELVSELTSAIVTVRARLERTRLEQQRQGALHFFASMDRINLAIRENDDFERMMGAVLDVVLSVFHCDRAWLLYPCDLSATSWRAPMERTRPEYPGIAQLGIEVPIDAEVLEVYRVVLGCDHPVAFGAGTERPIPAVGQERFRVHSMLAMAIHPKQDKPYMFGLHHCHSVRHWTPEDAQLLQEIGRRLADGLSSLHTQRTLRQREAQLRAVMQTIPDLVWLKDLDGVYLACNRQCERLFGDREERIVGKTDYDFFDRQTADAFRAHDRKAIAAGRPCTNDEWLTFADGGYRGLFETVKTPLHDHSGAPIGVVGVSRDITERHQAEEQRRVAATAFEAQEGIIITDARKTVLKVNRAFTAITGYASEDAVGKTLRLLQAGAEGETHGNVVLDAIGREGSWQGEVCNRRKSGERYPAWTNITAVRDAEGSITHYVVTMMDITARKAAEQRIEQLAYYDALTQLPNRRLLMDRLQQALRNSAQTRRRGALLFIDLDNFKILNDTIGHDVGDRLLCKVAQRLTSSVRDGDTIARLGGDEFVIMLEELSESAEEAAGQAKRVGEQVLLALNRPYMLDGRVHHSTPSIGVALFSEADSSVEELLKQADIAMYQAKSAGRNALRFFDPDMQAALAARATLDMALRRAIQERQFTLHYQPQVDGVHGIIGAEALLRWNHPQRGLVSPGQFIALAEETGLILAIGQWVLESACAQLSAWAADSRARDLYMAINVSALQFRQPDFVDQVRRALQNAGARPQCLKLELTESLVLADIEDTIAKMQALRELGVGFAMDDFGTGFSSLSNLTRLPLDQLKIDQSFVRNLPDSPNDAVVVQTIISLARSLGLAVIAEGVESEAQREFLERNGCPTYQGYLFSPPVAAGDFALLTRG